MAQYCPAKKLEKLLVSTDGSEFSEGAVREAINLAKNCSIKLFAVSVVETNPEYEAIAPQLVEKAEKEARLHLESIKSRASKEGVDCEIMVCQGEEPHKCIIEEAEKNKVNMIVLGRRGRKGFKRLMMGSETARVIGHSPCNVNVLVVPRAAKLNFNNVLVATDGSRYGDAAVSEAVNIAGSCNSRLIVMSVIPSETESPFDIVHLEMHKDLISERESKAAEEIVKAAKALAEKQGVSVRGFILAGRPYEAIIETAKENKADLIVVGSHGRTGLAKLLMGSVTERVIGLTECAVLVVKA